MNFFVTALKGFGKFAALLIVVSLVLGVLVADVVFGELGIGEIIRRGAQAGPIDLSQGLVSTCISLAGTAVRFCMWEHKFRGVRFRVGPLIVSIVLVVFNTLVDEAAITRYVFGGDPGAIFPAKVNTLWLLLALIVAVICTMDCLLTHWLIAWLQTIGGDGSGLAGFLASICLRLVMVVRGAIMISGIVSVLLVDLVIGAVGMGGYINSGAGVFTPAEVAFVFSSGTSAIQLMAWQSILQKQSHGFTIWAVAGITITLDLLVDMSAVGYLFAGHVAQSILLPHATPLYTLVVGIVALLSACDTYFLIFLADALGYTQDEFLPGN